ncbi:MAG TPA: PBP1A family penicillin-binding protein [Syntrophales bacterium]|nr:PBP1A family penicillin-binding protein [Syntrophales bacterium]
MKRKQTIFSIITKERIIRFFGLFFAFICIGILLYCLYSSFLIGKRFSTRRWSIPSKVFSDTTILFPGQRINRVLFLSKLRRLEYRDVRHVPGKSGEMRILGSAVELYLHDLEMPDKNRKGFPLKIAFRDQEIEEIVRYDRNEKLPLLELEPEKIMLFFGPERQQRQLVSIDRVPEYLIQAVLTAEDNKFYEHRGINLQSILRALYVNVRHGTIKQGGSTLTQQLAKSYFLTPERTFIRKSKELLMALIIEVMYKKKEILEIYLNEIYLGQKGSVSINGVGEASFFYFGKPVDSLTLAEAATIAGLIKSPGLYSPYINITKCRDQRNKVLRDMEKLGYISREQMEVALSATIKTVGFTVYGKKAPYFVDYLSKQLPTLYSAEVLSSQGLSIYTTLDTQVQEAAEKTLEKGLARLEKTYPSLMRSNPERKLQGAVIVMQPKTGSILAMVGGRDYSTSQFNRASQAHRQPGSAFKPFVYLTGLDQFTPATVLSNSPKQYEVEGKLWTPHSLGPVSENGIRMRDALARSDNLATVDLAMKVGLDRIVNTANIFQFSTPIKPQPSLALGSYEVVPLELARAYCTFASDGVEPYPLSLKAVVAENGNVLERRHMTIKNVISPTKAYLINDMLRSVITDGTGKSLKSRGISFPVAGKTGTTNDFRDAWFVGYTPDILVLVWVGFDNGDTLFVEGAVAALPIWADLVSAIPQYVSGSWFIMPPGVVKKKICPQSGLLAVENGCPGPIEEVFLMENVPVGYCQITEHRQLGGALKKLWKNLWRK